MKLKLVIILFILSIINLPKGISQDDNLQKPLQTATSGSNVLMGVPLELQAKTAAFFKALINSDIDKAYEEFLKNSPISQKTEQIRSLIEQTKRSYELYGQMKGYEPVNSDIVSESLIRLRYLGLHSKYPMRWIFTFYHSPDKGWIIINLKYDDMAEYFFQDE
jgi:hypothetical protein